MNTDMRTEEFEKFVASQQEPDLPEGRSDEIREQWLRNLKALYHTIIGFLKTYIDEGSISCAFTRIEITEELIGTYEADRMDVKIGRQRVSLVPVGTLLVGCKGRVDIVGSAGRAQILLVNKTARSAADLFKVTVSTKGTVPAPRKQTPVSWAWKILTNVNQKTFEDIDKDSFFKLLMEVAGA